MGWDSKGCLVLDFHIFLGTKTAPILLRVVFEAFLRLLKVLLRVFVSWAFISS